MSAESSQHDQGHTESVFLYALQALPSSEVPVVEAHLSACPDCRREMETLRPILGAFVAWPTDVLRPSVSLWERLTRRIALETGQEPVVPAPERQAEQDWEEAAPGLSYRLLAADTENDRVSLLVRLAPGAAYPPHRHAGVEELYLLHGELMIDDKSRRPSLTSVHGPEPRASPRGNARVDGEPSSADPSEARSWLSPL